MRAIRKYYILDIGTTTYDGVCFTGTEYIILRSSKNQAVIKAAIKFLKGVL